MRDRTHTQASDDIEQSIAVLTSDPDTPTLLMFGAGAGYSSAFDKSLRLPLGDELRNQLLDKAYPLSDPDRRAERFQADFNLPPTPDAVWQALIKEQHRLAIYSRILNECYSIEKPIPPAYYMMARWFFSSDMYSIATTNFDEKLDRAFETVGLGLNLKLGRDYFLPRVPKDYEHQIALKTHVGRAIQKLHGTVSMPWSIVAGMAQHPDDLQNNQEESFLPYDLFSTALKSSAVWIFVGYSFKDKGLRSIVANAYREDSSASIFIVDKDAQAFRRLAEEFARSHLDITHITCEAEDFLGPLLHKMGHSDSGRGFSLEERERNVLRHGPKYIPGCDGRHILSDRDNGRSVFQDNVHGEFTFSEDVERTVLRFIDTGELQRLRYIKQLSFVHLKHPGATHDRFTHTLGVSYLADRAFSILSKKSPDRRVNRLFTPNSRLSLVLACLFHDTGHGPLGHTMDQVRHRRGRSGGHEQDSVTMYRQAVGSDQDAFADLYLAQLDSPVTTSQVLGIMKGDDPFSALLSGRGIDLDRLDFLLRDGFATLNTWKPKELDEGRRHRLDQLRRISSNLDTVLDSLSLFENTDGTFKLVHARDAQELIGEIADLYCYMYDEVYYCWQNVSAQAMISLAVEKLLESHKFGWYDLLRLTDIELFAALEEFENPLVQELAYLVKYRRLHAPFATVSFQGGRLPTVPELVSEANIPEEDRYKVLVGIKPEKIFQAEFFNDMYGQTLEETALVRRSPGRLMFFGWGGEPPPYIGQLREATDEVLQERGASEVSWEMRN